MLKRTRDGDGDSSSSMSPPQSDMSIPSRLGPKRQKLGAIRDEKPSLQPLQRTRLSRTLPSSKHGNHRIRRPSNTPRRSSILALTADRLTSLPHEIIIRILHLLPFKCVLLCQLVSRRMRYLAGDPQVWKGLYYERFVRPRVMRLRGPNGAGRISGSTDKSDITGHGVDNGDKGKERKDDGYLEKKRSRGTGEDGYENRKKGPRKNRSVEIPVFSSRDSKWLDEWWLVGDDVGGAEQSERETGRADHKDDVGIESGRGTKRSATDWKARYKLRHNWSIGVAEVKEISLYPSLDDGIEDADKDKETFGRDTKTSIARLGDGVVITVNTEQGLRAWDLKTRQCVAQCKLIDEIEESNGDGTGPTCLAIDSTSGGERGTGIVVGFMNGHFEVWRLRVGGNGERSFERQWKSPNRQRDDELSGVAYADPHLLTITAKQVLSIYIIGPKDTAAAASPTLTKELQSVSGGVDFPDASQHSRETDPKLPPDNNSTQLRLLTSLRSHNSWPPLYLSIRSTPHSIIASIAYSLPTYLSGWSVGLQELHLSPSGTVLKSRLASANEQGFHSLLAPSHSSTPPPSISSSSLRGSSSSSLNEAVTRRVLHPTSLSYSHPYLLAGNRDNTLTLYLVTSNNEELKISKGTTLWGHTSSVSGAQVGGRGKAVSVSTRGDELRVWELEAGLGKKMVGERSVRVKRDDREGRTGIADSQEWVSRMAEREGENRYMDRGWVGFDDEVVIVLKGGDMGECAGDGIEQKLVVYDFT